MNKIGLALSGGGIRGIGHLGVLKALEDFKIKPSIISGTSAGAIVAAFYAAGYTPEKILDICKKEKFFSVAHFKIGKAGLFDMKLFEDLFTDHLPGNAFEKLPTPIYVTATDIVKGETHYFSSGNLSEALLASSCIPLVFQPREYNDTIYLDGGILDNFPVGPLVGKCDMIIGSHVNAMSKKLEHIHMKDMLDRSFHFALSGSLEEKIKQCGLFIEPPEMSRFGMFDFDTADEIFSFCYQNAVDTIKSSPILKKL